MQLLTLGKWRHTTGAQSNEDSQDSGLQAKGDLEMKAYRVTGNIGYRQFESYYTAKSEAELIIKNCPHWIKCELKGTKIVEMSKKDLVRVIKELM